MRRAGTGVVADRPVFSTSNLNSAPTVGEKLPCPGNFSPPVAEGEGEGKKKGEKREGRGEIL